jgi:hypothetical protein
MHICYVNIVQAAKGNKSDYHRCSSAKSYKAYGESKGTSSSAHGEEKGG